MMMMTPKIRVLVIVSCVILVFGISIFSYYQVRGEVKEEVASGLTSLSE